MEQTGKNFRRPEAGAPLGLALASRILGLASLGLSVVLVGGLFGVLGLVLGLLHLKRHRDHRAMAGWGTGLSIAGIFFTLVFAYGYLLLFGVYGPVFQKFVGGGRIALEWKGVRAPDFAVTTLSGEQISLSGLKGKRVVIERWATWCSPCRAEIPHFVELVKRSSRDDLVVIGVSEERAETLRAFEKKQGINYPIASARGLPPPYKRVASVPTTFFIDRNGVIQEILVGYKDYETLREAALSEDYPGVPKTGPLEAEKPNSSSSAVPVPAHE